MDEYISVIGGADGPTAVAVGSAFMGVFLVFYFLVMLFAFAFAIASYVLTSLGLYTVADRRGLRHKWLAWVPVGNTWLLGSISDQYQYVAKGKVTNHRKVLLALNIATVVVYIGWLVCVIGNAISGYVGAMLAGTVISWLLLAVVAITLCVFLYMSYYDLFRSCQPSNAVLYLVLSILFSVTMPFFVFFVRKKDLGMPPRRQPPVAEVVAAETPSEETVEEIAEEPTEETTEE